MSNITFYKDFLNPDLIKEIKEHVKNNKSEKKWQNSLFWPEFIRNKSTIVSVLSLDDNKKLYGSLKTIYNKIIPETKKLIMEVNYYIWPPLSYIPFHDDSHKIIASTIYLNEKWGINWGGLFLYYVDQEIKTFFPTYNTCIINNNNLLHGTSLSTMDADNRETIQIFFYEP